MSWSSIPRSDSGPARRDDTSAVATSRTFVLEFWLAFFKTMNAFLQFDDHLAINPNTGLNIVDSDLRRVDAVLRLVRSDLGVGGPGLRLVRAFLQVMDVGLAGCEEARQFIDLLLQTLVV